MGKNEKKRQEWGKSGNKKDKVELNGIKWNKKKSGENGRKIGGNGNEWNKMEYKWGE